MIQERSPMRVLAMKQFTETFGDLLSIRASVSDFERVNIEHVFEQLFFSPEDRRAAWTQRVRAAFHFLDHGSLDSPQGMAEHFLNCGELVGMSLNTAMEGKKEARDPAGMSAEALIRRKLGYYKDLLEGPYRVLLAPIAYGFARTLKNGDSDFVPSNDGKAKLGVLPKIERLIVHPQNQLGLGVNTHVRNAYSHTNYRIIDWEHVELWDEDPHGRKGKPPKTWGPETWHIDKLDELADDLELTNLAFLLAITIYAINNRQLIVAKGWKRTLSRPKLTEKELRISVEHFASDLGFKPKSFALNGQAVTLELATKYPGTSQTEEIFVSGKKRVRRLLQKVEYLELPVIEQLLGLLQLTQAFWEGYSTIHVIVSNYDGKSLGEIKIDISTLSKLEGPNKLPPQKARALLSKDTLGDAKMNYRQAHPPQDA